MWGYTAFFLYTLVPLLFGSLELNGSISSRGNLRDCASTHFIHIAVRYHLSVLLAFVLLVTTRSITLTKSQLLWRHASGDIALLALTSSLFAVSAGSATSVVGPKGLEMASFCAACLLACYTIFICHRIVPVMCLCGALGSVFAAVVVLHDALLPLWWGDAGSHLHWPLPAGAVGAFAFAFATFSLFGPVLLVRLSSAFLLPLPCDVDLRSCVSLSASQSASRFVQAVALSSLVSLPPLLITETAVTGGLWELALEGVAPQTCPSGLNLVVVVLRRYFASAGATASCAIFYVHTLFSSVVALSYLLLLRSEPTASRCDDALALAGPLAVGRASHFAVAVCIFTCSLAARLAAFAPPVSVVAAVFCAGCAAACTSGVLRGKLPTVRISGILLAAIIVLVVLSLLPLQWPVVSDDIQSERSGPIASHASILLAGSIGVAENCRDQALQRGSLEDVPVALLREPVNGLPSGVVHPPVAIPFASEASHLRIASPIQSPSAPFLRQTAVSAVVVILVGANDQARGLLRRSFPLLYVHFLRCWRYPVRLFGESGGRGVPAELLSFVQDSYPGGTVDHEIVDFTSLPHGLTDEQIMAWNKWGKGYRMMCRFFSGLLFQLPSMQQYDYFMRVDTDSWFPAPLPFDPITALALWHRGNYGYDWARSDDEAVTRELWPTLSSWLCARAARSTDGGFARQQPSEVIIPWKNISRLMSHVTRASNEFLVKVAGGSATCHEIASVQYDRLMYETNFELGALALFRSEAYQAIFTALDSVEPFGFFRYRWGDSAFRPLGVHLLSDDREVVDFHSTFRYGHGKHGGSFGHQQSITSCPVFDDAIDPIKIQSGRFGRPVARRSLSISDRLHASRSLLAFPTSSDQPCVWVPRTQVYVFLLIPAIALWIAVIFTPEVLDVALNPKQARD